MSAKTFAWHVMFHLHLKAARIGSAQQVQLSVLFNQDIWTGAQGHPEKLFHPSTCNSDWTLEHFNSQLICHSIIEYLIRNLFINQQFNRLSQHKRIRNGFFNTDANQNSAQSISFIVYSWIKCLCLWCVEPKISPNA